VQTGPAALSVNTSYRSPYPDAPSDSGFLYAYRSGSIDQADNRALRACAALAVPIVYFFSTRPGWYKPIFPCYVTADDPVARRVTLTPGQMRGPIDDQEPELPTDPLDRKYTVRTVKVRLHQARFRGRVLPAYRDQCAICHLKEVRLLDAAHIIGDTEVLGDPAINNGLSLCSIHHRAFDEHLIGVSPDYETRVAPRLLADEDGPMLDLLKMSDRKAIAVPRIGAMRPDRERLAKRFEHFLAVAEA
jgi:putative restriction endonuclease